MQFARSRRFQFDTAPLAGSRSWHVLGWTRWARINCHSFEGGLTPEEARDPVIRLEVRTNQAPGTGYRRGAGRMAVPSGAKLDLRDIGLVYFVMASSERRDASNRAI
jgi:hypothetical protein